MQLLKTKSFQLAVFAAGDKKAQKIALVLPGRLDTKDYAHMRAHVDFLASRGYYALSFDPPGTWESPGGINLYTEPNYLRAALEVIELLGNRPTLAMGHSRGGKIAMELGVQAPAVTHIIAAMSIFGPASTPQDAITTGHHISFRDLPPGDPNNTHSKRFDLPLSYFQDTMKYEGLDTCVVPKLFFVGRNDPIVRPELVRETYRLAGEPKQLHELDSDHDYRYHPQLIAEINKMVGSFLDHNL